jgi:hypothetical protein
MLQVLGEYREKSKNAMKTTRSRPDPKGIRVIAHGFNLPIGYRVTQG